MDDLIRRSDAIDELDHYERTVFRDEYKLAIQGSRHHIRNIPAVDAVEVVHAHWEDGNKSIRNPTGYTFNWWCSHCGKPQYTPVAKNLEEFTKDNPRCHWCGARMDGRREDGDT